MRAPYVKDNSNMINEFVAFLAAIVSTPIVGKTTSSTRVLRGLQPCSVQTAVQATHTSWPFGIG